MRLRLILTCLLSLCVGLAGLQGAEPDARPGSKPEVFAIQIIDEETGRGVPLVELKTTANHIFMSDSAGYVAVKEPELLGQKVYFHIRSHGYEFPADGFGYRGRALDLTPGGTATLRLPRRNVAERLYRITGAGIYADSVALGMGAPILQPLLNAQVTGCDSVYTARYRDKIYWFWGDTNRFAYPLGNFHTTGATSALPTPNEMVPRESRSDPRGATRPPRHLDPDRGIDFTYFTGEQGFARPMAPMPGEGPTWISGLIALPDASGRERLFCGYEKIRGAMEVYARGIAEFDDEKQQFVHKKSIEVAAPLYPWGHPFTHREGDVDYVYFGDPYPVFRVRANAASLLNVSEYEGFSPLVPGSRKEQQPRVERNGDGQVAWAWKRDTAAIDIDLQKALVASGELRPHEAWIDLRDVATNHSVAAHRGSVAWNDYRQRWVLVFTQYFGTSLLGEVWYSEADAPQGPWRRAVKIVSHDRYSFYNPQQHPLFAEQGGKRIYFEGTYTHTFSGNPVPTPRYDYNQIMYRLDVDDERLKPVREK